jgi:hypothetical protein
MQTKAAGWRQTIVREAIEYWINFLYLAFFLVAFVWYRRLILAEYHVQYTNYWFPLIEAAVVAKVIMVGDVLRVGRRLEQKPLPIVYRTVMFSVLVAVFSVLEATVRGLIHGQGLMGGFEEIVGKGRYELLARAIVIFVAFVPFFTLKELDRVLGEGKLRALLWRGANPDCRLFLRRQHGRIVTGLASGVPA